MNQARAEAARLQQKQASVSIARELTRVEERLHQALASREALLTEISNYLILSGGKRVRPSVALLIFRACGGNDARLDDIVDVAVALELIHSASLLHDDIIDGSMMRRGRDSALRKFGLAETLVAGDFLFGQAYDLCARFDARLIRWAVRASIDLTEGEVMQGRFRRNPSVTVEDYFEIIQRKTASLFEAGARTAAFLADGSDGVCDSMAAAGRHVGMTFQIIDDLIDITGSEDEMGKPVGIDLRDGNPSLPIVLAIQDDTEVRRLFERSDLTEGEISALLGRLRRSPHLDTVRHLAHSHAESSREALRAVPASDHREHLLALVDQLVDRIS